MKVHSFVREVYPLTVRLKAQVTKADDNLKVILKSSRGKS